MSSSNSSRFTQVTSTPPSAGSGLHEWILAYTRQELAKGQTEEEVQESTWHLCHDKGRKESILRKEIADAVAGASKWLGEHPEAVGKRKGHGEAARWQEWGSWYQRYLETDVVQRPPPAAKWKAPVDEGLIRFALGRIKQLKLKPRDRFSLEDLFVFNFPICIAKTVNRPVAKHLEDWQLAELRQSQWMVPNPCMECGEGGGIKNYTNAGERIWLIIEFDCYTLEEQAKLLCWLDRRGGIEWQLAMIVFSGSKSLHGWFSSVGKDENKEIVKFFKLATRLGCDRAMASSVQYTRFPLGWNTKTKRRQEILHWNERAFREHQEQLEEEYS